MEKFQQFELDLEPVEVSQEELTAQYMNLVGINPTFRNLTIEEMKAAIENPEAERERLMEMDRESDQEEVQRTYRR